jgi:hypothetical protein
MRPLCLLALFALFHLAGSAYAWPVFAVALAAVVNGTDPLALRPRRPTHV